jgi:hypothetical protein
MAQIGDFIYTENQLLSHIASPDVVRLENFTWKSNGYLQSRKGFETIHYFIGTTASSTTGTPGDQCLLRMERGGSSTPYVYSANESLFLGSCGTENFRLFGDSFYYTLPNGSGFAVIPFSLTTSSTNFEYRYYATDATTNSSFVEGSYKNAIHNYNGKIVFISGNGSYQIIQNGIGTSSSNYTRFDNNILPVTNQTLVGAASFENRLLFISQEGYLMWSPVNWDGITGWRSDPSNLGDSVPIILESGEKLETITVGRNGIVISSRNTAKVSGNIYNINTLDPASIKVIRTGQNAFFSKGALIQLDDQILGLSPQGLLSVGIDSLTLTAVAKNESSAISEYMIELFRDNTVYNLLDSFLDTKSKTAYYIVGQKNTDNINDGDTKILSYQYDLKKWSLLRTKLPIQRLFMYYGTPAAAGYIVDPSTGYYYLALWSFSELYQDTFLDVSTEGGIHYWNYSTTSTPYTKYMVSGNLNLSAGKQGGNGDARSMDNCLTIYTDSEIAYKAGFFVYSAKSGVSTIGLETQENNYIIVNSENKWADGGSGAKYGYTKKDIYIINEKSYDIPKKALKYQFFWKSDSDAEITIIDLSMDNSGSSV